MAKNKIGAYITLDGEKEFRSAVTDCNKSISTMRSEMKLVEAQTAGNANTLDTLRKKNEVLTKIVDEHSEKEEALKRGLSNAERAYNKAGNELEEYKQKLLQAKSALEEMQESSSTSEEELTRQKDTVQHLSKIVEKGEETYRKAGNRVQDWQKQLNNAEAQTIKATRALNENAAYMKEAEEATDGCAKSINAFGKEADNLADEITSTGKIIKENLTNTVVDGTKELGKDLFSNAVQGTLELQDAQKQLQASTGATARETKEYASEMQSLYREGYGDSIRDTANAMALVKQYTNETDPEKIRELAENGIALEDVFDIQLSESIRAADALIENMGVTGEEAFDLMAKGAQNGLNKSDELADNITEYSSLWGQAGFSAQEMFAILENGLNSGAYNLDKVNDYVKEFGISLSDGRIEKNINAFSENTKTLFGQWKNGEATTKQVFQSVIADLANMENQQQALTIASNTWSSLGEDNAMKVITSLNDVNNSYKNVHGTMEKVKDIKYDSVTAQWKTLGRTFQTDVMQPVLVKFLPTAQKGMKVLADNIEVIVPVATTAGAAIGTIFVVNKSKKFISEVKETGKTLSELGKTILEVIGIKTAETVADTASATAKSAQTVATTAQAAATTAQAVATTEATVAQTGLNTAMAANPVGLVVAGVTALVGVTALLASNVEESKTKTEELRDEAEKLQEKVETTEKELEESTGNMKASISEVAASGDVANGLVKELEGLASQSKRTSEEQTRMQSIVMQLNTMFPEMSLAVDEVTGKLNMSSEEMQSYIDSAIEMQKIQVIQEKMAESVEKLVDAQIAEAEAGQKVKDVNEKIKAIDEKRTEVNELIEKQNKEAQEAQEEYSKALQEGAENTDALYSATQNQAEAMVEYNGKTMTASEALQQMAIDEEELTGIKEEYAKTQESANEAVEKANESMAPYTEYLNGMADATDRGTDSLARNTEEKQKAGEQAQASIEIAGQEVEAYNTLSVTQQEMAVNVTNAVLSMKESVESALDSQMDMFEKFDGGVQISTEQLLSNMQSQVDGVTSWEQNLSSLADKGINQGILQKLAEMGPQGSGYVTAFNNMTTEEIAKANSLWDQSVDIKGMTNEWGQQLLESGAANIAGGMENLTPIMQASGANTVLGLVQGMQSAQNQSAAAGKDLGVKTIDSVNEGLGVHSPSTKTTESGKYIDEGLANGMNQGVNIVVQATVRVAEAILSTTRSQFAEYKFVSYGRNVPAGLARGILQGRSEVIRASQEVARAAIRAANDELEIRSPSRVFMRMGENTMGAYALGVKNKGEHARKAVSDTLNFRNMEGKISGKNGTMNYREDKELISMLANAMKQVRITAYLGRREITRGLSDLGVVFNAEI